uniref:Uncharacterized protein n=1 Tax=Anopheles culicifacies TaxID=139723 RepID=A0A182LXI8_9DIPT
MHRVGAFRVDGRHAGKAGPARDFPSNPNRSNSTPSVAPNKTYTARVLDKSTGYGGIRSGYQHFSAQGGQDSGFPSPRGALGYPFPPMHQNSYSGYHLGSYAPPCASPPKDATKKATDENGTSITLLRDYLSSTH